MEQNKSNSNISKHLPSLPSASPAFAFAPPQLDSIKCAPPRYPPNSVGRLSRPALRFTSTTWVDFLNELSSALSSQLSRCSTVGTRLSAMKSTTLVQTFNNLRFGHVLVRPGQARPGSHTSKSKAEENFLTKCQVSCR